MLTTYLNDRREVVEATIRVATLTTRVDKTICTPVLVATEQRCVIRICNAFYITTKFKESESSGIWLPTVRIKQRQSPVPLQASFSLPSLPRHISMRALNATTNRLIGELAMRRMGSFGEQVNNVSIGRGPRYQDG